MKKGQVVSVHHTVPTDSPFKSYKDMKRYWKNTYGYRLPESEEGVLFYQVYFKLVGQQLFTYPHYCIRPSTPVYMPSGDDNAVISSFLQDLQNKVSTLCGRKLRVISEAQALQPQLAELCELGVSGTLPNLSDQTVHTVPQRVPPSSSLIYKHATLIQGQVITVPLSMRLETSLTQEHSTHTPSSQVPATQSSVTPQPPSSTPKQVASTQSQVVPETNPTSVQPSVARKIIPMFRPLKKKAFAPTFIPNTSADRPKTVPQFKANVTKMVTSGKSEEKSKMSAQASNAPTVIPQWLQNRLSGPLCAIPPVKPLGVNSSMNQGINTSVNQSMNKSMNQNMNKSINQSMNNSMNSSMNASMSNENGFNSSWSVTPNKATNYHQVPSTPVLERYSGSTCVLDTPDKWGMSTVPSSTHKNKISTTPGCKRSIEGEGTPKPKKPRAKPKVQGNVDVELLARTSQLGKVNTVTLVNWLKERGVVCKAKDKKTDLVQRVYGLLNL